MPTKHTPVHPAQFHAMPDEYVSVSAIMKIMGLVDKKSFKNTYLLPALKENAIERKYPDISNHPRQQYRLTEQAKAWKNNRK